VGSLGQLAPRNSLKGENTKAKKPQSRRVSTKREDRRAVCTERGKARASGNNGEKKKWLNYTNTFGFEHRGSTEAVKNGKLPRRRLIGSSGGKLRGRASIVRSLLIVKLPRSDRRKKTFEKMAKEGGRGLALKSKGSHESGIP